MYLKMTNTMKLLSKSAGRLLFVRNYSVFKENLWTPAKIVRSPYKDIEIPNSTIPEHIWRNMEKWADKPAVVCGITNRTYTYHHLYKSSRIFAANLRSKLKVETGDVICIMKHNSPEFVVALLGILQAGGEVTTVNPIYTPYELQKQLLLSNPTMIIGSTETVKVIKEAFKLMKKEIPVITVKEPNENLPEGTISFQELSEDNNVDLDALKGVSRTSEDIGILPYSSGTTGFPKGVELTNRNIVANCVQQDVEGVKQYHDTT
ncbi:4-coumarate--CoA ligase 1-like, partial [Hyposmocoma kahamanoa]|uniref:4-coumarate--CoA ligase 1-like n=1 Tax=Hyposmocoma kahamanoa TaxID=1477025 RepID=UPI000E6D7964